MNPVDLKDLLVWEECYSELDLLAVSWLNLPQWYIGYSIELAHLCNKHRVKTLIFTILEREVEPYHWGLMDQKLTLNRPYHNQNFPDLPYLKTIKIDRVYHPTLKYFILKSRVTKVHYVLDLSVSCDTEGDAARDYSAAAARRYLGYSELKEHYHLRLMTFTYLYIGQIHSVRPDLSLYSSEVKTVQGYLDRNQHGWEKCQKAVVTVLGLGKRKEFQSYRNVFSMVAEMIASTSGTSVWMTSEAKEETLMDNKVELR